jgi:flagellar biosynthesis protein FlhB
MADHDQDSRTERASEKRLREAREKGDSPRSRDFSAAAVTLAGVAMLLSMRHGLGERVTAILHDGLSIRRAALYDSDALGAALLTSGGEALALLAPIFAVALAATLAAPLATGGLHFSGQALGFKGSRLDPLAGVGRMFSMRSLVELAKALLKVAVIAVAATVVLRNGFPELVSLSTAPLKNAASSALDLTGLAALALAAALAGIGMIDLPYQIWDWHKRQRMTREELKQEYKESEGSPEVKGKVRQLQAQIARRRMMADVPTADVVVTNPTHFAVALKYDDKKHGAPIVVAKGVDHVATQIREIARKSKVTLLEAPPLARALYRTTEIGAEIPSALYVAVAQVLAYVFQLRRAAEGLGPDPEKPTPEVDPSLSDPKPA